MVEVIITILQLCNVQKNSIRKKVATNIEVQNFLVVIYAVEVILTNILEIYTRRKKWWKIMN